MFLKLSLAIFFVVFLLLFLPSSLNVNLYITCDRYFLDIKKIKGLDSKIQFKICSVISVFNKKILEHKKVGKKKKQNKFKKVFNNKNTIYELIDKSYVDKLVLSLGFNLDDYIANSYVNATLNSIICMYINLNQKKFNLKKLYYQTYIGEKLADLKLECIIKISLADTIRVITKEYFKLLKQDNLKKRTCIFEKRREEYGGTSD